MQTNAPKFLTIRELAQTGILSEYCLRKMLKQGQLPVIYSGKKALINFDLLCQHFNQLPVNM